jgi:hypothetical protein
VEQSVVVKASADTNAVQQQYEYERFVVRLGPHICKLEQETVLQLGRRWEMWLNRCLCDARETNSWRLE